MNEMFDCAVFPYFFNTGVGTTHNISVAPSQLAIKNKQLTKVIKVSIVQYYVSTYLSVSVNAVNVYKL